MRKAPPSMAGLKARMNHSEAQDSTFHSSPQATPTVLDFPLDQLRPRPMRDGERSLLRACWWRWRREGTEMPAERGVIVIDGGRL